MNPDNTTIIMAPLQGFTDRVFRQVYARHFSGVAYAVAPFISTMGQHRLKPSRIRDVDPALNTGLPVVPQILGNQAKDFIFLANHLYDMGHPAVNWNLGCPHSKIARKVKGSGLLAVPEMIDSLLSDICAGIRGALSMKVRSGRKSDRDIFALMPVFNRYPLTSITVHPRTGIQMYDGRADLDLFARLVPETGHHLIYNGDIVHPADYETVRNKCPGVTDIMIGRGLLSNPFAAEEIKRIPVQGDRRRRLKDFHDDLFFEYQALFDGPAHLIGRMKGFWSYLGPSFDNSARGLKQILKSSSAAQYTRRVNDFFEQHPYPGVTP